MGPGVSCVGFVCRKLCMNWYECISGYMCVCLYVLGFEVNIFACVGMDIVYVCLCTGNYMRLLNVACKYISGCNCVRFLLSS